MKFSCEMDKNEFLNACTDYSKLFGSGSIIKAFSTRLGNIETYPYGYADNDVNTITPGKTGFIDDNINNKIKIKLIGFLKNNTPKAQTKHYIRHEIAHAMSVAAQDVYSTRQKAGINNLRNSVFQINKNWKF